MSDNEPQPRRKQPFQFGLASMLLVMVLVSVLSATFAGPRHRHQGEATMRPGLFVVMAIAAPAVPGAAEALKNSEDEANALLKKLSN